mgnify:CR=1 FL=1
MKNGLPFQASGNTNPFDDMFSDTHGGTMKEDEEGEEIWEEENADDYVEDEYNSKEQD